MPRLVHAITRVAEFEITLLVKKWIVRYVNLAIRLKKRPVCFNDSGAIEKPISCRLEHRRDDANFKLSCKIGKNRSRFARNGFRQMSDVLLLIRRKILRPKQLLQ